MDYDNAERAYNSAQTHAKERFQLFPVGARAVETVPGLLALSTYQAKIRP